MNPNNDELQKAIEEMEALKIHALHQPNCKCPRCVVVHAAKQLADIQRGLVENDTEIGEFQNMARDLIMEMVPGCNPDGEGCESGDWRDFTLAEIAQGIAYFIDERDSLKQNNERMREVLQRIATEWPCDGPSNQNLLARQKCKQAREALLSTPLTNAENRKDVK